MPVSALMETIIEGIRDRRVLLVDYTVPRGFRRVEPHACGLSQRGNEVVRVFQTSGPSRSGRRVDYWKLMRLDRICELEVLDDTFDLPRPGYKPGDEHMIRIFADFDMTDLPERSRGPKARSKRSEAGGRLPRPWSQG